MALIDDSVKADTEVICNRCPFSGKAKDFAVIGEILECPDCGSQNLSTFS